MLQAAQGSNSNMQKYIALLEAEIATWRAGGNVAENEWATSTKAGSTATAASKLPASPSVPTTPSSRSLTPINPVVEGLKAASDTDSRPQTPTAIALEKDEREEFLRRENELTDQLGEKESAFIAAENLVKELKEELTFLKEQEANVNQVMKGKLFPAPETHLHVQENKTMSSQINDLRLQVERLNYDNKEGVITIDILKEQHQDTKIELEEFKKQLSDAKNAQKDAGADDKEKKKQERMALMMAKLDTGAFSEKDEQLRHLLSKLDSFDGEGTLSQTDLTAIRRQLGEGQNLLRDTMERLQQSQEVSDTISRRKEELEARLTAVETEYEELLGNTFPSSLDPDVDTFAEKTIQSEETRNDGLQDSMADLKASPQKHRLFEHYLRALDV